MKRIDLIRHLQQQGCFLVREGRRHSWWGNPVNKRRSAVPRHTEVPDPLARKICRDLDVQEPLTLRLPLGSSQIIARHDLTYPKIP